MAAETQGRWLGRLLGWKGERRVPDGPSLYTAWEVKRALRGPAEDDRVRRVHACAARLGARIDDAAVRQRFRGLEDYHRRLLRILTLYCRGWETSAIARDLSLFSTGVGVEHAIEAAATLIADDLNQQLAA